MKLLFVAMSESVHTARWIKQLAPAGWDIHVFPSCADVVHPELTGVTYHPPLGSRSTRRRRDVRAGGVQPLPKFLLRRARRSLPNLFPEANRLARLVRRLKPDIVHSLELQHAGYLTMAAHQQLGSAFPPWIVTNWGSDIYLFGRAPEHREKIESLLSACDFYDCECQRDVRLARQFGFRGHILPVAPNAGGFDLARLAALRDPAPTSSKRLILLKGYQGWAGRAFVGLRAIRLCANVLRGFRVAIYNANPDVEFAAQLTSHDTGIPIEIVPKCSHEDMLRLHGAARMSIGLSIGDGLSTSFLEAVVMGSFPIQSNTAAADEWIEHGASGMIVEPEDPHDVAAAIRRAATDDALVDRASGINSQTARRRLGYADLQNQAIRSYQSIVEQNLPLSTSARAA